MITRCPEPSRHSPCRGAWGTLAHFAEVLTAGKADAALAASLFHDRVLSIGEVKSYLAEQGIPVRPTEARDGE